MSLIQGLHCDLQIVYSVKVNSVMLDFCNFLLSQSSPSCKSWIKKDKRVSRDSKTGTRSSFAKIIITAHKERALAAVNLQSALRRPEPFKAMKVKVSHAVVSNSLWPQDCSPPGFSVWNSPGEYWSGLPFPSSGDLPNPGIELRSPTLQASSLMTKPAGKSL